MATKSTNKSDKSSKLFTEEERAAIQERAKELKTAARRGSRAAKTDGEADVLAKIAEMPHKDRVMATRLHEMIKATVPALTPKTWYGMPAYANEDGKLICYFTAADKFKSRYATFGFEEWANLDEGNMWPTSFALTKLTAAEEARIVALLKQAVS